MNYFYKFSAETEFVLKLPNVTFYYFYENKIFNKSNITYRFKYILLTQKRNTIYSI